MRNIFVIIFLAFVMFGCSGGTSESYLQGQTMADETYGAMSPKQMVSEMKSIGAVLLKNVEAAENKKDWWNGFCDRGEEIWLERIDDINSAMGHQVFNSGQIENMFDQMRAGFRE